MSNEIKQEPNVKRYVTPQGFLKDVMLEFFVLKFYSVAILYAK
jgi:hypothetical protein